jgi:lysophospholipase L1-like esterase
VAGSRAAVLACLPVVVVQGRRVRRTAQRLPEATGAEGAIGSGGDVLRLVVAGDSVAAGVGVPDHIHSMAGRLAVRLHERTGRPVNWRVLARSGAEAHEVAALLGDPGRAEVLARADFVVVSVGVNDVKNLRSDGTWRSGLGATLDAVVSAAPTARVFVLGLPPVDALPALPRPLADLLGARGRRMDRIGAEVAEGFETVTRLEFTRPQLAAVGRPFATDGFHPGAELHEEFAREIDDRISLPDLTRSAR